MSDGCYAQSEALSKPATLKQTCSLGTARAVPEERDSKKGLRTWKLPEFRRGAPQVRPGCCSPGLGLKGLQQAGAEGVVPGVHDAGAEDLRHGSERAAATAPAMKAKFRGLKLGPTVVVGLQWDVLSANSE